MYVNVIIWYVMSYKMILIIQYQCQCLWCSDVIVEQPVYVTDVAERQVAANVWANISTSGQTTFTIAVYCFSARQLILICPFHAG